jgi:glycine oxidase
MREKEVDYIVVGQGLAGSCLALQLLYRHKRILVIDKTDPHSATQVAAGLFNPVSGAKMVKTWMADALFPYLHEFYRKAEYETGARFFFPMPVYRPFVSPEEQNEWMGRSADPVWTDFIDAVQTGAINTHQVKNPHGGILLKQCGYVHTQRFTRAVSKHVRTHACALNENLDEDLVHLENGRVRYREWSASRIVFCQGDKARSGEFFSWLPLRPLKGETLTIRTDEPVTTIYNRGVYLVPDIWKVGATYSPTDQTPQVTEKATLEICEKLNELISFPYEITGQEWGIRPVTPDRRPILGPHPDIEQFAVFNGLGTKGVSLAPYFSGILCDWMEHGNPLHYSVSVSRYKSLYSKSA